MNYYAVTLGSTYNIQKEKQIFWAPSKNKEGNKDISWYNYILKFKSGDILFAFVDGYLTTTIEVKSDPQPATIPEEMKDSNGKYKYYKDGYQVKAEYNYNNEEILVNEIMDLFKYTKDSIFAEDNRIKQRYIQAIPNEIGDIIFDKIKSYPQRTITTALQSSKNDLDKLDSLIGKDIDIISKARVNQSKIRTNLLKHYKCCQLCGVQNEELLIASHIKPWSKSNEKEKVDCYNLLLLCANHDKLFDRFLITFDDNGEIKMSSSLSDYDKIFTNIREGTSLRFPDKKIPEKMKEYLEWHRNEFKNRESKLK